MRTFTRYASSDTRALLGVLIDPLVPVQQYQQAMTQLGRNLASQVVREVPSALTSAVCIVCTVEDADFLARGMLEGFEEQGVSHDRIKFVCFWNERVRRFDDSDEDAFDVAPIVKSYREDVDIRNAVLVVVKSIISSACVVKTNLAALIDDALPKRVIVAAPVMLEGADRSLASQFAPETARLFEYVAFAIDDRRDVSGRYVEPGVGGSVYDRLGYVDKTAYVPELVKARRRSAAHV